VSLLCLRGGVKVFGRLDRRGAGVRALPSPVSGKNTGRGNGGGAKEVAVEQQKKQKQQQKKRILRGKEGYKVSVPKQKPQHFSHRGGLERLSQRPAYKDARVRPSCLCAAAAYTRCLHQAFACARRSAKGPCSKRTRAHTLAQTTSKCSCRLLEKGVWRRMRWNGRNAVAYPHPNPRNAAWGTPSRVRSCQVKIQQTPHVAHLDDLSARVGHALWHGFVCLL
jgi:hypothetical protein